MFIGYVHLLNPIFWLDKTRECFVVSIPIAYWYIYIYNPPVYCSLPLQWDIFFVNLPFLARISPRFFLLTTQQRGWPENFRTQRKFHGKIHETQTTNGGLGPSWLWKWPAASSTCIELPSRQTDSKPSNLGGSSLGIQLLRQPWDLLSGNFSYGYGKLGKTSFFYW